MENIIKNMIALAEDEYNLDLISSIKELLSEFAYTYNCPSNWNGLGEELAEEYSEGSWVYENLELWNYVD